MSESGQDLQSIRQEGAFKGWTEREIRQYREQKDRLFGHLDTIQVNAHGIRTCLGAIKGCKAADKDAYWQDRCVLLSDNLNAIQKKLEEIRTQIFGDTKDNQDKEYRLYQKYGDEVAKIEENYSWVMRLWNRHSSCRLKVPPAEVSGPCTAGDKAADAFKRPTEVATETSTETATSGETKCAIWSGGLEGNLDDIDKILKKIIHDINLITMPMELNEQLGQMFVGDPLDFVEAFGDEFDKDKEEGTRLLRSFKSRPYLIDGLVDVDKGVIYKVDVRAWRRNASWAGLAVLMLFGIVGVPWILVNLLKAGGVITSIAIPSTNLTYTNNTSTVSQVVDFSTLSFVPNALYWPFIACALALVIGFFAHILVGALKGNQGKEQKEKRGMAMESWFYWIHVNEISLGLAVITLWIGFAGIVLILGTTELATAFFVGYSIDSFVDLILTRVSSVADVRAKEIEGKFSGTAVPSS